MKYLKRLPLVNIKNARDLGGIPNLCGQITNWSKIYRTASLDDASFEDIEYLKDLGINTVIDLRRSSEIDCKKVEKIKENFNFHHISLAPDNEFRKEEIQKIIKGEISIGASYRSLIDHYTAIKEIMEVVANAENAVIYHCQEGKDRTGIVTMVLLGLCDVGRGDIIADYEVSSAYLGYIERYDKNEPHSLFRITDPYYMREAYEYVIRKYESFEEYLKYAKVDESIINKIREKLLK